MRFYLSNNDDDISGYCFYNASINMQCNGQLFFSRTDKNAMFVNLYILYLKLNLSKNYKFMIFYNVLS